MEIIYMGEVEIHRTINYYFDNDTLKYWDEKDDASNFEEIDLNDFIDWKEVYKKAEAAMMDNFPKGTKFVHNIDDE